MQKIHHPSPSQVPIIYLLGDSSDSCVARPECTGLSAALADMLGNISVFHSVRSCSLARGSGYSACYFKCPAGGRRVSLRATEGHHPILLC